jgi:hypothetical protein
MRSIAAIIPITAIWLAACSSNFVGNKSQDIVSLDISSNTFYESSKVIIDIPSHTLKSEFVDYSGNIDKPPRLSVKKLDEKEQERIIESISRIDFNKMKNEYNNEAVVDGVKLQVIVKRAAGTKTVVFDNYVTLEVNALVNLINSELNPEIRLSTPQHIVSP